MQFTLQFRFKVAEGNLTSTPFFLAGGFITVSSRYPEDERGNLATKLHQLPKHSSFNATACETEGNFTDQM